MTQGVALSDCSTSHRNPGAIIVWHFLEPPKDQSYLDQSVLFPGGAIASDGTLWTVTATGRFLDTDEWPLPPGVFAHPRSAGTLGRHRSVVRCGEESVLVSPISPVPEMLRGASISRQHRRGRRVTG